MPTHRPPCQLPAWLLVLPPALTLLLCGLLLHPLAPEQALALLTQDAADFMLAAGSARLLVLAGTSLLAGAAILFVLALFRGGSRRIRYHAGMIESGISFP